MFDKKINRFKNLVESLKSDINNEFLSHFLRWFYEKINTHFNKKTPNLKINKGDIYYVELGQNIGSELNKTRPCLVISIKKSNFGNTIIIVPLKSFNGKNINNFQLFLEATSDNNLNEDSIIDFSGIRQVSKKRLLDRVGKINDFTDIDNKLKLIFGIKK
ncbi:MAG: type II toxin-antitoxin system PemK/MazF family toxin [Candidatus Gracilibacteria bacterium]|nr:type II toxin-antitoxin system PemK/MazF family toxin [Candidatus Gracilibacteria bacterium]